MASRRPVLALFAAIALVATACEFSASTTMGGEPVFDAAHLGGVIEDDLSAQLGGTFEVECPEGQSMQAGTAFECVATDEFGRTGVIAVVAADDQGNVDWEVVEVRPGLDAPSSPEGPEADPPAASPPTRPADVPADWVLFAAPDAGYLLWHPADWIVDRAQGTAVFSGPEGSDTYRTTVNVQIVTTTMAGGIHPDVDALYTDLRDQVLGVGGEVFWEEDDELHLASGSRRALAFQAYWEMQGEVFMQLVIVLPRDAATLAQLSYTAPVDLYEDHLELALTVMESFDVVE